MFKNLPSFLSLAVLASELAQRFASSPLTCELHLGALTNSRNAWTRCALFYPKLSGNSSVIFAGDLDADPGPEGGPCCNEQGRILLHFLKQWNLTLAQLHLNRCTHFILTRARRITTNPPSTTSFALLTCSHFSCSARLTPMMLSTYLAISHWLVLSKVSLSTHHKQPTTNEPTIRLLHLTLPLSPRNYHLLVLHPWRAVLKTPLS